METTNTSAGHAKSSTAGHTVLAIIGFIALVIIGIALAIYTVTKIPDFVSRISGGSVSLPSFDGDSDDGSGLAVVATTSLPINQPEPIVTAPVPTTPTPTVPSAPTRPVTPQPTGTYTVVTTSTTQRAIDPNGLSDLKVTILQTGYLRSSDTDSFVASDEVPDGHRGAVRFSVTNEGTNVTDTWKFKVDVPTSPSYTYHSGSQHSLKPGDRIDFVLGFTEPREGDNREITVTVDSDHDVRELSESNNVDSEEVDIDD